MIVRWAGMAMLLDRDLATDSKYSLGKTGALRVRDL